MAFTLPIDTEVRVKDALKQVAEAERLCREGAQVGYDTQAEQLACQYYQERLQKILDQWGRKTRE